jgi:hypothetical protein
MLSLFARAKAMENMQLILARHQGGVYKRIDENRELLMLLQTKAPDLLAECPWVVRWLESTDDFLVHLEQVAPVIEPQFGPHQSGGGHLFPRAWPAVHADVPPNT